MDKQFENFLSEENFYLAFKRLQTVDGYAFYKSLYRPDLNYFGLYMEDNINFLIHKIQEGIYQPQSSFKIYVPKKNNLVRPLTLLHFEDLLVYQAIINIVGDVLYDEISTLQNNIIFGNIYNKTTSESKIFLFEKWKKQWKKYNQVTEDIYNEGYEYFSDFDIASFFDTINHNILTQILVKKGVEANLAAFLQNCLAKWSVAINRQNYVLNQGLPQGPVGSALLADIYLLPIDEKVTSNKNLNIRYQRYVDDIRILSKTEIEGKKAIAYLDLLARDFGLIPQSTKISTRHISNIKKELKVQHSKFSDIAKEFTDNDKKLKPATHKKQKRQFLNCFVTSTSEKSNDDFLNKTIISFSLFKLNKDDEVKDAIIANIGNLYPFMQGVLFYLSKHYSQDSQIQSKLLELINGDNLLFQHIIALIYKEFSNLPYSEELFLKHYENNTKFWLIKYYVLDWLKSNGQQELINSLEETDNYFINRKILAYKSGFITSSDARKRLLRKGMKSENSMLALQANYLHATSLSLGKLNNTGDLNPYIGNILTNRKDNFICHKLKSDYGVSNVEDFFDEAAWDKGVFQELKLNFLLFINHLELDPSISLMSLNNFNEIIFGKLTSIQDLELSPKADFGGSIDMIKAVYPITANYFHKINDARNQKTYAHYKDKSGNIRIKISFKELNKLIHTSMFQRAIQEICNKTLVEVV